MLFRIFGVLFTVACTKAIITAGQHLTISPSGTHVKAVNTNAILTCTYADFDLDPSAPQLPDIRWTGPDMNYITDTSGRLYVERHDSYSVKLYINKLVESDAGIYSCTLDINGESFKAVTELKLQQDVDFDDTVPDVYRYRIGESGTLGCRATGHPVPTISWRRLGHKLPEDTDKYTYEEDGLIINEIRLEDNGTYECRAQVESAGSLKVRNIHLDVLYPPEFKRFPYVGKVIQGKPAVLECEGDGNPPVRYEWLKEKVMSEKVKAKIPVSKGNNTYTIENPKPSDEGRYYCRISNSVGIKDAHLTVTMLVPPKIQPLTESRVILEGVPLILPCEVTGSPIPQIVWHKMVSEDTSVDVTKLNDTNYSVDHTNEKIGKLIVQNIQRNQSGRYVCMASNEVGNDSSSIQLTVDYQPTMVCSPSESFGWGGQVRNFTCVGHGQPLPTMNWNRQGQYIADNGQLYSVTSSRTSDSVTTTLKISIGPGQPWIFGRYSCTAKNTHGHAARNMELTEAELPDMPHNVTVIKKSATSVTLQVAKRNQTGGLPVTSWMVKYQAVGAPDEDVVTVFFDPGKNLTIVDLEPDTEYTIYVAAGNDFGFGNPVKFLVETPTKSLTKEQSDVPREETVDTIVSTDDENGSKGESAALEKTNVSKISPSSGESGSDYLGVIIGVVVAVILLLVVAIILTVVFLRRRRNSDKNKRSSHSQRQGLMSGHRAEVKVGEQADVDSMQLQIRRPDDKLPDLIHSGSGSDRSIGAPGSYSGHPVYSPSPKLGRACAPPTPIRNQAGPTSAQKDAWDRMQQEAVNQEEDNLSLGSDRPVDPKLSILTDHGFYEELKPKTDPERSVADILDGYHSGNELGE